MIALACQRCSREPERDHKTGRLETDGWFRCADCESLTCESCVGSESKTCADCAPIPSGEEVGVAMAATAVEGTR